MRLLDPMPPAPAAEPEALLRIPRAGTAFPRICPGCGADAETEQAVDFERNPFTLGSGYEKLMVPFCSACVRLTAQRRRALTTVKWIALAATLSFIPLFDSAVSLLLPGTAAPPAFLRIGSAALMLCGAILLLRYVWLGAYRRWFFGFRIVGADDVELVVQTSARYVESFRASSRQTAVSVS